MQRQIDITDVLKIVEVSPDALYFINLPYQKAVKGLSDFKSFIQTKRKELAKRYHPDKGGDEEKMKEINQAVDLLMTLGVCQVRPRPVMQHYTVYQSYYTGTTGSSTGSVYYGYGMS